MVGFLGLLVPTEARAQANPNQVVPEGFSEYNYTQVRAGNAWPVGGLGGLAGLNAGVSINFQRSPHWGGGLEIDYFAFNKNTQPFLSPEPRDLIRKDLSLIPTIRYILSPKKSISPVLLAGIGLHYWDATHFHTGKPGVPSHTGSDSIPHRGFGYKGAGLLGLEVTGRGFESLVWTVAARWLLLPEPREFRTSLSSIVGQTVTLTAAIGLDL